MSDFVNKLPQGIRECIERPPIEDKIELAKSLGFFNDGTEKENKEG